MQKRAIEDRRVINLKKKPNSRAKTRRNEDVANIKAYYIVLGISIATLVITGILTFIWGV